MGLVQYDNSWVGETQTNGFQSCVLDEVRLSGVCIHTSIEPKINCCSPRATSTNKQRGLSKWTHVKQLRRQGAQNLSGRAKSRTGCGSSVDGRFRRDSTHLVLTECVTRPCVDSWCQGHPVPIDLCRDTDPPCPGLNACAIGGDQRCVALATQRSLTYTSQIVTQRELRPVWS